MRLRQSNATGNLRMARMGGLPVGRREVHPDAADGALETKSGSRPGLPASERAAPAQLARCAGAAMPPAAASAR